MTSIDRSKISTPKIYLSESAASQLNLMFTHDPSLEGKALRLSISGKGCDGFKYSVGFDPRDELDFICRPLNSGIEFEIVMDAFAAFYLQHGSINYVQDFENDEEGFVIENHDQEEFAGKFWRKDETKAPPLTQKV